MSSARYWASPTAPSLWYQNAQIGVSHNPLHLLSLLNNRCSASPITPSEVFKCVRDLHNTFTTASSSRCSPTGARHHQLLPLGRRRAHAWLCVGRHGNARAPAGRRAAQGAALHARRDHRPAVRVRLLRSGEIQLKVNLSCLGHIVANRLWLGSPGSIGHVHRLAWHKGP